MPGTFFRKVNRMIELFDSRTEKVISFEDSNALFEYIRELENQKQLETRMENDRELWSFIIHSNQRLSSVYWRAIKAISIMLTEEEQEAYEKGYHLLEICKGDIRSAIQVILTPEVDIEEMKKNWCEEYCSNHGYTFIGTKH
jgi:hypothetical protein